MKSAQAPVVYVGASGPQGKNKHHQWLTDDVGDPHLRNQISQVLGIMRAARNKGEFFRLFERAFPGTTTLQGQLFELEGEE